MLWDDNIPVFNIQPYVFHSYSFDVWEEFIVFYWSEEESGNVFAKIFDTDGSLVEDIPENGIEVCTQINEQIVFDCVSDEAGNSIVIWKDERAEYAPAGDPSLYIQKLDLALLPVNEEEITGSNIVNISNYPNPFMGSTILKCDLPRGVETAEIEIFNIRGQKVRTLPAARSEVEWDCRNETGKPVGAGIYLYRLAGEGVTSKAGRMILLR